MHEESQFVVIGKVVDTYGLKGEIKMESYLEKKHWKKLKEVFLKKRGGDFVPFKIEGVKLHGRYVIVKFSGCEGVDQAKNYKSAKVFLPLHQLPKRKKDEYYYFQLEGLQVYTESGKFLGKVTKVLEGKPYYLLEMDHGRGYIPFIGQMVKEVDIEGKKIKVSDMLSEIYP
ncbi:16S rRNA processing protein RimM [Hydrogenobacter thermophilus TK-6]|uniref:Ribosome maturation factor RimM n=1 Tax=Hydrogenobacter thermophilus (strain DSM 6534 / IAM 12695 / TK-6) TaxID=608538 RepID=D3DHZ3_HYDTT|nr:ribosome maturation factor RimM [Hydrogenobacter thermophilus]ADO45378.1 16S rRNA processing protein RimM [Hydrogenobacter thermophilus TK-6]BAI69445.1 16S rRNA processing protein RimM [Hydrogenobacter thermophilus TK-6]